MDIRLEITRASIGRNLGPPILRLDLAINGMVQTVHWPLDSEQYERITAGFNVPIDIMEVEGNERVSAIHRE